MLKMIFAYVDWLGLGKDGSIDFCVLQKLVYFGSISERSKIQMLLLWNSSTLTISSRSFRVKA